jgi:sodium transport system ATP-binding protein
MLEVKNLKKTFDRVDTKTRQKSKVGIFDISFNAEEGKIFGLIGANGAGKTTTMRILASLTSQHSGEVLLDGKIYSKIPNIKMQISFVSGETQIYDRLTPYETMKLFGEFAGLNKKDLSDRINNLAEKLDMRDFMNDTCGSFSTGMKQKVSIARALVTNPKVLIFDEITNGLDIFASRAVKDQIKELKAEGKIILYSTHIMPDADELCDNIAILHKGNMLEYGNVTDLRKKYKKEKIEDIFFSLVEPSIEEEITLNH